MNLNTMMELAKYPDVGRTLFEIQRIEHADPAKQSALEEAGRTLQGEIERNPELVSEIGEQVQANPELKTELTDLARNDPEALNAMMPDLVANSGNLAEVIANHRQPTATEPQVADNSQVQTEPAPENQLPPIELGAASEPAAGAAMSSAESARNDDPEPVEVVNETLAERATPTEGTTNTERSTLSSEHFNPNARADGQTAEPVNQAEAENSADRSAEQQTLTPQEQMLEIMADLRAKPGGEEFFDRIENNPTLSAAVENAMLGEGGNSAQMLATMQDVQQMVEEDDRLLVKVNQYMDDHPGAMQTFANTFANDPDKAFMDLKMGMMTDNIQNMLEGPLTSLLGPELAGKIMGWIEPIMQLFAGFNEMFPQEQEAVSQSNDNGPSLSSEVQEVKITVSVDQNGQATARADNAADNNMSQEDEPDNNRQGTPTASVPGMGN